MDYNNNFSNTSSDPYFTLTSFDSDITNPAFQNFNQTSMLDWSYLNQYMPQSQYYEQDWDNHHDPSSSQKGYISPSLTIKNFTNKQLNILNTKTNL